MKTLKNTKHILSRLLFSIREVFHSGPLYFAGDFLLLVSDIFLSYLILYGSKKVIDTITNALLRHAPINEALKEVSFWLLFPAALSLLLFFLGYVKKIIEQKQQLYFQEHLNIRMAEKCMELDISYFDNPQYYDKIDKAQKGKIRLEFILYRVLSFFSNITSCMIAFVLACCSGIPILFPLLILLATLPSLLAKSRYYRKIYTYDNASTRIMRKVSYLAGLILGKNAAKEIRFYKMGNYVTGKYRENWTEYADGKKHIILRAGFSDSLLAVLPIIGILFSMYFVTCQIINGSETPGDFAFFLGIFTNLSDSFLNLVEDLAKLSESETAIQNYREFMSCRPNTVNDGTMKLEEITGIRFHDVSFSYPGSDRKVLDHISFRLYPDRKNAIVGINGAGKTTILKLLLRFYDVSDGEILINDIDIKKYDLVSLRSRFSAVFQDFVIYSLSLRDNIAFSDYGRSRDDNAILDALDYAGLKDDILRNAASLDTFLSRDFSEDGIELSGGQKQKIAIARCAFAKSQILVMDEPTASLDPEAEAFLISKLIPAPSAEKKAQKGLILISHRLSNMKSMDQIIVIKDGRVLEEGTHEELMKRRKEYYSLFTLQASRYKQTAQK